jgi:hypothetical protein
VYMDGSLIYGEKQPLVHGAIEVPLPLGENLQTFVVANADEVADAGQLSTAVIRQNDNMQKPVYISEIIGFTSDNSVKSLDVELNVNKKMYITQGGGGVAGGNGWHYSI